MFGLLQLYIGDSAIIYPGENSYQISLQTNCVNFTWSPSYGLSDAHISNPLATIDGNMKYIVTGTTEWGCKATDSISIYVSDESIIGVPNAFTPGNGPNSKFKLVKKGIVNLNYFRIYNRWGNLIFETNDIEKGWDGSYNGAPQPYDVYIYMIQANTSGGKLFTQQGNVTLIR